jgi:hypothetical protein
MHEFIVTFVPWIVSGGLFLALMTYWLEEPQDRKE